MNTAELRSIQRHATLLSQWGINFREMPTHDCEFLTLCTVPLVCEVPLAEQDVRDFVALLADDSLTARGARPPAVTRLLNYKACHGAIMFGDELNGSE